MLAFLQAIAQFIISTAGISIITAALAVGLVGKIFGMIHWHTVFDIAIASAVLISLSTFVTQFFHA
jgi:hypothetical protein